MLPSPRRLASVVAHRENLSAYPVQRAERGTMDSSSHRPTIPIPLPQVQKDDIPDGRRPRFAVTEWDVVLAASTDNEVLWQLLVGYRLPIYDIILYRVRDPDRAEDHTHEFLMDFYKRNGLKHMVRREFKFRSFLTKSVLNFLKDNYRKEHAMKRGGQHPHLSLNELNDDGEPLVNPAEDRDVSSVFDKVYAELVWRSVCESMIDRGHNKDVLRWLLDEPKQGNYETLANTVGTSVESLRVYIHRLRGKLVEEFRRQVAETLTNPNDIEDEVRYLSSLVMK